MQQRSSTAYNIIRGDKMITCVRCGLEKEPHKLHKDVCVDCIRLENNLVSYNRQQNEGWMDIAKEACIEVWERQPGETDLEWSVWLAYRDAYPGRKPSYRQVAEDLTLSVGSVQKIGARWDFSVRMQAWARFVDNLTLQKRQQEILSMNQKHVTMAMTLNEKLARAIERIDPEVLKPSELSSLMKIATDLERKARLDQVVVEQQASAAVGVVDPSDRNSTKDQTAKKEELQEVVDILMKAGVLGGVGSTVGVRQVTTTTTEVISKDDYCDDDC